MAASSLGWYALTYSPAFRGGLIEANRVAYPSKTKLPYSPAFRGGLIEARRRPVLAPSTLRIPPRFAGASLKLHCGHIDLGVMGLYSPAFRGGLIEAGGSCVCTATCSGVFPRVSRGPH